MLDFKKRLLAEISKYDDDSMTKNYAQWLLSEIESNVWEAYFEPTKFFINWSIRFGKSFLTSPEHAPLLLTLKYWLLLQTHPICCESSPSVKQVAYQKVTGALRQIDYMLLHDNEWKLSQHGFGAVSSNDILNMLYSFETNSSDEEAIYTWNQRLSNYLIEKGKCLTRSQLITAKLEMPSLFNIELPEDDWVLSLSRGQLVKGRIYLWSAGLYKSEKRLGYEFSPNTLKLAKDIYRDTLRGQTQRSIHEELCINRFESYLREYKGVNVRMSVGEAASQRGFNTHKAILLTLSLLVKFKREVPDIAIKEAFSLWTSVPEQFRAAGRFRPPSFWHVMDTFRDSTEFVLLHGEHLVRSYLNVVSAAAKANKSVASFVIANDVADFLDPSTRALGATTWSLRLSIGLPQGYPIRNTKGIARIRNCEYFPRLRSNEGVIDLLQVLCGSIQHNVGAVTARRQSELRLLPLVGALDSERKFMIFKNAKSGEGGVREQEIRPIPSLVTDMLGILEMLHYGMPKNNIKTAFLFSVPGASGRLIYNISSYNSAIDSLCDYFQTPLDKNGMRSYIRQHQLRKFFAITFYYGSANANLDTLRWFLGHLDAEHLWHYITAMIPGDMLRSIQSTFLVDELTGRETGDNGSPPIEINESSRAALESLVLQRFGTKNFALVEENALEDYMTVLLKRGLRVEPFFFEGIAGKSYVMGVSVGHGIVL